MTLRQRTAAWAAGLVIFLGLLFALREVLTPFVAGMAIAYLLDPACDKLEAWGCSRTVATCIITAVFFVVATSILLILVPLLTSQIIDFTQKAPEYFAVLREKAIAVLGLLESRLPPEQLAKVKGAFGDYSKDLVQIIAGFAAGLWRGIESFLTLALITPVVTFYLLRDWDRIIEKIDGWLPRSNAPVIRTQIRLIDETLAGFARGQATVCLLLGIFYGIGLSLVGLDFGLIVGFATGLISFVPYFGMLVGFAVGIGIAIFQFGELVPIGLVALVFGAGQILEGNFLTPKLVGDQVGLHAVWIIFALLAGGALFGFVGVLLSVPLMAVIGVVARFFLTQYLDSQLYLAGSVSSNNDKDANEH